MRIVSSLLVAMSLFSFVSTAGARSIPTSLSDPMCQQAVSLSACQAHVVYTNGIRPSTDTSPIYMRQIDPRANPALNHAGDSK